MKFTSAAALLAFGAFVASIADAGVLFNSPLAGAVWTAGSAGTIVWTPDGPSDTTIPSFDLLQGPATALQSVLNIGVNIPFSSSNYTWNIPASLPTGNDYTISAGISPNIWYSAYFAIKAASGASSSTAFSSLPTTSSSSMSTSTSGASTTSAGASSTPSTSSSFPIWTIAVIVVLIVIISIGAIIWYRTRKTKAQKNKPRNIGASTLPHYSENLFKPDEEIKLTAQKPDEEFKLVAQKPDEDI
ncbi:hypothetical protein BC943DRAFT_322212 [Umbelopsis sp. AD052]|nr:hypothetical protein BC943DRAFT_322212 [Umbelopsis sp. AD052]